MQCALLIVFLDRTPKTIYENMAPIPDIIVNAENAEAVAASILHHFARRDEEKSRTAGWIVGLLVAGCIILTLIYYCLDDAFGMKPRKGKKDVPPL